ncbi:MAG: hypothetical protein R2736_15130 [Solirubrobacterales bacterium]
MPKSDLAERQVLEADETIMQFQRTMEEAAQSGALNPEELDRFVDTMRDVAARVNDNVLPQLDAVSAQKVSRHLLSILTFDPTSQDVLDSADHYLIHLEAIRHVFRDILHEHQPEALRREGREVLAMLEEWLPGVSVRDLASLLGISTRALQRRRHEESPATPREQLVARLVAILRGAWTDAGVNAWFYRPRYDLGGARPIELLDDGSRENDLLDAARSGRVQGAA